MGTRACAHDGLHAHAGPRAARNNLISKSFRNSHARLVSLLQARVRPNPNANCESGEFTPLVQRASCDLDYRISDVIPPGCCVPARKRDAWPTLLISAASTLGYLSRFYNLRLCLGVGAEVERGARSRNGSIDWTHWRAPAPSSRPHDPRSSGRVCPENRASTSIASTQRYTCLGETFGSR